MLHRIDSWHRTTPGLLVFGLAELAAAYGFVSLAIDRGNFWWYLFALVFLVGALQNLIRFIGRILHVGKG
jgi:hypothetical protein